MKMRYGDSEAGSEKDDAATWARIVIVIYNSAKHLQSCVDALAAQDFNNFEAVIVNNASPDDCVSRLRLPDNRFHIVEAGSNLGFAAGSNLGAMNATSQWLITLNPDTHPRPDWLSQLHAASLRAPEYDFLGSTLIKAGSPNIVDGFGDVLSIYGIAWRGAHGWELADIPREDREVFGACAAAAAYRRSVFERHGGFDERYFCYLEDVDLSWRLQRTGSRCLQVRNAIVKHVGQGSGDGTNTFPVRQTYRNGLRVILSNAPILLLPIMIISYGAAQTYIVYRNRKGPEHAPRMEGLRQGFRPAWAAFGKRSLPKNLKRISVSSFLRRIAWSPAAVRDRRPVFFDGDVHGGLQENKLV